MTTDEPLQPTAAPVPITGNSRTHRRLIVGVLVGLSGHVVAAASFALLWIYSRHDAPTCFPDEDGVAGILAFALLVGIVTTGIAYMIARARGGQRFLLTAVLSWLAGLLPVIALAMQVLAFRATLGSGCGGSSHTPWW
jgi:hypothetical protein